TPVEPVSEDAEVVARITASLKSGDLLAAVEDSVKLAKKSPGSSAKAWASDRIIEAFLNLLGDKNEKLQSVRGHFFHEMQRFDAATMADWSKKLFTRGYYSEAAKLAEKAQEGLGDFALLTAPLFLAGKAHLASDQYHEAKDMFAKLVDKST